MQAVDYFAGMGGTTTGAEAAGVHVALAANHWREAVAIHAQNHPETEHVCQDLMEIDHGTLPRCELLLASPSCRGFSEAGQPARKGTGGSHAPDPIRARTRAERERNTSWAVVSAAEANRPQTIMVENVERFLSWVLFPSWCDALQRLGYVVRSHVLDASRFGGAQERRRVIVTASLRGPIDLPDGDGSKPTTIGECLSLQGHGERWKPIAKVSDRMRWRMRKAQSEAGSLCFWANVSESRGRHLGESFPTATRESLSQWYLLDSERCRMISPREMARAFSFPDSYVLPRTKELAGPMLGNAVDCRLARAVIERLTS